MGFNERVHAYIAAKYYTYLVETFGERGRRPFVPGTQYYPSPRGRRRAQRAIRESGYLREAEIDKRQNAQLTATRLELREQAQALGAAASRSLDSAIEQYAAQAAPEAPVETGGELDVQG